MQQQKIEQYKKLFGDELERTAAFWLDHGMDEVNRGVYTSLDRQGNVYSTDKSVWMQGRCAWTYSELCEQLGSRPEWLAAAKSCIDFMNEHCFNPENGRMYFTVTADGKPLRQRRYYFSETFYIMANAQYAHVTGDEKALENARKCFKMAWGIYTDPASDPVKMPPKSIPETRSFRALGPPMILLNVSSIMRKCDTANAPFYTECTDKCLNDILTYHYKPELQAVLESVGKNGEVMDDIFDGRVVNPGHVIEACWFMLDEAEHSGDTSLVEKAKDLFDWSIKRGWDEEYGGILYFTDLKGLPCEQCEHDMKLWWPHNEAIIASLKLYSVTGDEKYAQWFDKLTTYAFDHFADPEYGEWYGYLRRDGKPTLAHSKGTTFKGPFHLPRMLMNVLKTLDKLQA